jgi:Arc/MetJ-type ribon-helix-helix transcriptional regulator
MTIHLPEDLERFVHDVVRAGRYAREDDVIRDALIRLQHLMPEGVAETGQKPVRKKPAKHKNILTEAEVQRHMLEIGLMSQLPDADADFDDPDDQPVIIKGEPISETIIRARR